MVLAVDVERTEHSRGICGFDGTAPWENVCVTHNGTLGEAGPVGGCVGGEGKGREGGRFVGDCCFLLMQGARSKEQGAADWMLFDRKCQSSGSRSGSFGGSSQAIRGGGV